MTKVFLGGTCNETTWRDELIPLLESQGIDYFNPVVDDWTPESIAEEERQKATCTHQLFMITKEMTGVYSIAEAVDCSNKNPKGTIFAIDIVGFNEGQLRSLRAVYRLIAGNGGTVIIGGKDACFDGILFALNYEDFMKKKGE